MVRIFYAIMRFFSAWLRRCDFVAGVESLPPAAQKVQRRGRFVFDGAPWLRDLRHQRAQGEPRDDDAQVDSDGRQSLAQHVDQCYPSHCRRSELEEIHRRHRKQHHDAYPQVGGGTLGKIR